MQFRLLATVFVLLNALVLAGCGGSSGGGGATSTSIAWTWESGAKTLDASGTYGTLKTPASGNVPGARNGAMMWMSSASKIWVFGGKGYDTTTATDELNDLWLYDTSTGDWAWEGGSSSEGAAGQYGTLHTGSTSNIPGARHKGATWTDSNGKFWLFGGLGYDSAGTLAELNDLWMYDPTSGKWTWEGGPKVFSATSANYGSLSTPASTNLPGGRVRTVIWTDSKGRAWMFGGLGYDSAGTLANLNDLWMYDPSSGYWTWEGGSNIAGAAGTYGTIGTPNASNIPGSRVGAMGWVDASGNFWLFGGVGYGDTVVNPADSLNDLWMYNPTSGQWTWEGGSTAQGSQGSFGSLGTPNSTNFPSARSASVTWKDSNGNFWLFGGTGYDSTGAQGTLNDLWMFNPTTGYWTWEGGSKYIDQGGTYGTKGTGNTANIPGARYGAGFADAGDGQVWILGGWGYDTAPSPAYDRLNDLWTYKP